MVNRLIEMSSAGKYSQIDTFVDQLTKTTKKTELRKRKTMASGAGTTKLDVIEEEENKEVQKIVDALD